MVEFNFEISVHIVIPMAIMKHTVHLLFIRMRVYYTRKYIIMTGSFLIIVLLSITAIIGYGIVG